MGSEADPAISQQACKCLLLAGSRHWSVTVNKVNSCLRASADAGGLGGEAGIAHIVLCDPTSIEKHSLQDE